MLNEVFLALAALGSQPQQVPVPPGHRPFGPPSRAEVLEGWETFIDDVPRGSNCADIGQPMVQPLNPPQREEAVAMLSDVAFRSISDAEAARLLDVTPPDGEPLAGVVFRAFLYERHQRKHRAEVERRDSWSVADQRELERLTARFEAGDHRSYTPFLVRAVSKFGDGHGGAPLMLGDLCGEDLHLQTLVFSYTIPPSVRLPTIVFLPSAPQRVIASVTVDW